MNYILKIIQVSEIIPANLFQFISSLIFWFKRIFLLIVQFQETILIKGFHKKEKTNKKAIKEMKKKYFFNKRNKQVRDLTRDRYSFRVQFFTVRNGTRLKVFQPHFLHREIVSNSSSRCKFINATKHTTLWTIDFSRSYNL